MTLRELRNQIKRQNIPDLWWIAIDGKVQDERIRLLDLQIRQNRFLNNRVQLLNAHGDDQENWLDIEFATKLNLESITADSFTRHTPHPPAGKQTIRRKRFNLSSNPNRKVAIFLAQKERELTEKEAKLKQLAKKLTQREMEIENGENLIEARMQTQAKRAGQVTQHAKYTDSADFDGKPEQP